MPLHEREQSPPVGVEPGRERFHADMLPVSAWIVLGHPSPAASAPAV